MLICVFHSAFPHLLAEQDFKVLEKGRGTSGKPGSLKDHMEGLHEKERNIIGLSH